MRTRCRHTYIQKTYTHKQTEKKTYTGIKTPRIKHAIHENNQLTNAAVDGVGHRDVPEGKAIPLAKEVLVERVPGEKGRPAALAEKLEGEEEGENFDREEMEKKWRTKES